MRKNCSGTWLALAALLAPTAACHESAPPAAKAAAPAVVADADPPPPFAYDEGEDTFDGIGRTYFGREIARFMSHRAIGWLERGTRESEERTSTLLDALELRPDMVVADIGAGSGYFTMPMARRVPKGRVLATDIQTEMIDFLEARARTEGLSNVEGVLGRTDDAMLPTSGVDLVLLVDAYHQFDRPWEMARSIRRALRPGGRVALVEYRAEDPSVPIKPLHRMSVAQARLEWEAAGFRWVATDERLPIQHLIWFVRD
jgi:SAM-dependent methyltransferase